VFTKTPRAVNINHILEEERNAGLQTPATYLEYADKARQVVVDLKETIADYRNKGYVVAGYGAAAKGMTLVNFGDIHLDFIIDDNPLKQGKFTPGTHDPVVGIDMLEECKDLNVAFVPLAWNFFTEIKSRIKAVRDQEGDVFIRYFPQINIE
jgi:hypothetical protein